MMSRSRRTIAAASAANCSSATGALPATRLPPTARSTSPAPSPVSAAARPATESPPPAARAAPRAAARDEKLAHRLARAEDSVLDCAEREVRHFGDLVVAEVVRVSEHDEFAVCVRELADDFLDLCAALASLALLFGRERLARERLLEGVPALAFEFHLLCARAAQAAQVVDGRVVRDAVNPG